MREAKPSVENTIEPRNGLSGRVVNDTFHHDAIINKCGSFKGGLFL
jgi:hypothetical protein